MCEKALQFLVLNLINAILLQGLDESSSYGITLDLVPKLKKEMASFLFGCDMKEKEEINSEVCFSTRDLF